MMEYVVPECYGEVVESLSLYIKHDVPVLLTGPVGCGKSSLLRHIAGLSGRRKVPAVITLQLCKDLDGRALLGAYHCMGVSGEFTWIPGLLTSAVMNSSWVILEDLDNAAVDALSILLPLIQSRSLYVPELGKTLQAGPDFRLFATLRTHESRNLQNHRVDMVLVSHFRRLHLDKIPTTDILVVSNSLFPKLALILPRLIQVLELTCRPELCEDQQVRRVLSSRLISLRDFFKICRRLSTYVSSSSMNQIESIFLDLFTCLCAYVAETEVRIKLARMLGSILGLANSDVDFYASKRKPEILEREKMLKIGRSELCCQASIPPEISSQSISSAISLHPSVLRLLESLGSCISSNEAVLLVGETGTGKTTVIQYLADRLGRKLHVINLSHQAETSDLFGGYKPVEFRSQMYSLMESFLELFAVTFSVRGNESFLTNCQTAFSQKNWTTLAAGMRHIANSGRKKSNTTGKIDLSQQVNNWDVFSESLAVVEKQLSLHQRSLIFAFLEGTLVKSFRLGDWVLLDEINLATPELLAGLHCFIDSTCESFVLSDRGDTKDIERHPDFRLFACMNPATDVGKRELPADVRSRFTEIYCEELTDLQEIHQVVLSYLEPLGLRQQDETSSPSLTEVVANMHVELKALAEKSLMDGVNHKPHYSLRTFTQALKYAAKNPMGNVRRSLYEGFSLSYLTQLNRQSQNLVKSTIAARILSASDQASGKFLSAPRPLSGKFVQIEGYYVECGRMEPVLDDKYIMTETVKSNLAEIARAVSAGRIPVLLQGETSIGKTSLITWLAKSTGNQCVRINNHEFTDLQDYIGSYQTNEAGKLVFVEGVLVNAVRKGFWIILDELNLAPSDVLEALNRLLDSNRELFIPEKQEVIKAHPQFMLFATQNPPGYYGGRKTLSRAFRNRFIEMHFDEIPPAELHIILQKRCSLPPTYAKKIIDVMLELQARRKVSGIFAGKQGFMTLRDLFRWAERYRLAEVPGEGVFYDWSQHLADHGFLLLGGRVRKSEELNDIRATLEKHFKRAVDPTVLYGNSTVVSPTSEKTLQSFIGCGNPAFSHIVWTSNLRRMVVLAGTALAYGEPVLLVGETGCGKTTISQIYACLKLAKLYAIGCHMNTETSDFLGGLRPARAEEKNSSAGLFVWKDGPLVQAMVDGGVLLLDEISLAADSVLERINSVLEPERQLVLTEKGCVDTDVVPLITAASAFRLIATMNPGGDFGKKELSPALRNRFTEIWCDNLDISQDLKPLVEHNLFRDTPFSENAVVKLLFENAIMDFVAWFSQQYPRILITGRDVMSWISFINRYLAEVEDAIVFAAVRHPCLAYFHGTSMVFESMAVYAKEITQGIGATSAVVKFLEQQISGGMFADIVGPDLSLISMDLVVEAKHLGVHPFLISRRHGAVEDRSYDFGSASVRKSLLRILRGLMVAKGILLEGPPGVGKTSIVKALAAATGHRVVRINLSEQTDISELFGSDMPVEGSDGSSLFAWRDGPFLDALKNGSWILLDELNLASQSVLEGLNACLDHRGEIFIPELNRSFKVDTKTTRIFACQNPLFQGSGRKGLPKSFLSRFTQVYVEELLNNDILSICKRAFPKLQDEQISVMLAFNQSVQNLILQRKIGTDGQPWEFNLRDIMRWCELVGNGSGNGICNADDVVFLDLLYVSRFRSEEDRRIVSQLAVNMALLPPNSILPRVFLRTKLDKESFVVGRTRLRRRNNGQRPENVVKQHGKLQLLQSQSGVLEKLAVCVNFAFPVILVGPQGTAKSSMIQFLAAVTGNHLEVVSMNSDTDASDLLGGFEQNNWQRDVGNAARDIERLYDCSAQTDGNREFLREAVAEISSSLSAPDDSAPIRTLSVLKKMLLDIGQIDSEDAVLRQLQKNTAFSCQRAISSLESTKKGRFDWCDSLVVRALLEGSWLLIDNANLCSPAVLDRLNSVLEPNGELFVPERGGVSVIRAHPNFRLFMTTNPKYGELSRAMRNRGIEIFIPSILHERDCLALLTQLGLTYDVASVLLRLLRGISPLKALSLEDIQSLGKEVWMRLSENLKLEVALQKAVLNCSSFSESSENLIDVLASVIQSASSVMQCCPYPVTIRALLQDPILANICRHKSSLQFALQQVGCIVQKLVGGTYGLQKDGSRWASHLSALASGIFVSLSDFEEWDVRMGIGLEGLNITGLDSSDINRTWIGPLSQCAVEARKWDGQLAKGQHHLDNSRLCSSWIRSCFSWNTVSPSSSRNRFGNFCFRLELYFVTELLIVDMTLDNERVAEFFDQFGFWVADAVVTSAGCVFSLQSQNLPLKLILASLWFRSLVAALMEQTASSSRCFAPVIWRLFSTHVLPSAFNLQSQLPDYLSGQRAKFDRDFYVDEDETRVAIRKALVDSTPFSTSDEFRSFNALQLDATNEVVALLPTEEVLQLISDKTSKLLSFLGNDLVLRGSAELVSNASEDARFWQLLQIEFVMRKINNEDMETLIGSVVHFWSAFPLVLRELLLAFRKPLQMLTPSEIFSLKFELMSGWQNSDDIVQQGKDASNLYSQEIMVTYPDYQWWKEVLQLLSSKAQSSNAKLRNYQSQISLSKRLECHLWRKLNLASDFEATLKAQRQSITTYLIEGLQSVLPIGQIFNVNSAEFSSTDLSVNFWQRLHQLVPVTDGQMDQVERDIFANLTSRAELASSDIDQPSGDYRNSELFAWICSGIVSMKALFPPFVDPVQEQQTTRDSLQYQAVDCKASLQITAEYFVSLYGSGNAENFDAELVLPYRQQLDYVTSALDKKEMRAVTFRPEPSMYHALVQDARRLRDVILRRTSDLLNFDGSDVVAASVGLQGFASSLASIRAITAELRRKYFAYQDMVAPFLSGVHQVLYGFAGLLRSFKRDLLATESGGLSSLGDLLRVLTTVVSVGQKECTNYFQVAKLAWKLKKAITGLYKTRPEDRLMLEIRLILLVLYLLRVHATLHRPQGKSKALQDAVFMRFAVIWHDIEQVKKKTEEEKAQLYKFAADADKEARDTAFPSYEQDLNNLSSEMQAELSSTHTAGNQKFFEQIQSKLVVMHGQLLSMDAAKCGLPPGGAVDGDLANVVVLSVDIGSELISSFPEVLDFNMDATAFVLQSRSHRQSIETTDITAGEGKAINFYQDQNIGEAKKCVPVVLNVELRVKQLLDEWPSHPVLNEISLISERLLGFALTEPLAKLLMALELILDKCQHWEAKAHSGVSLQPQMEVLGNLIVEWRKLELSQWQSALDQVVRQKAEKATKWWLLLFSTVMETVADQAPANALASLITVIQRFVESSTLGEYRVRLALLQTMGLHFSASRTVSGNSSKREQVCIVLQNLHAFYSQFILLVDTTIADQRKPIEKELRNFVQVARWNDMNYWSLKHTIQKAHRTIHRHMKQLESVLDQAVSLKRPVIDAAPNPSVLTHNSSFFPLGALQLLPSQACLPKLTNALLYLRKSRRITRQILASSHYKTKLEELDQTSADIWDRFKDLQEPPAALTGQKRKDAMKTTIRSRRLAFTDLTKSLKAIGLSARKGMALSSAPAKVSMAAFEAPFSFASSERLRGLKGRCQEIYWANVSSLAVFRRLLEAPCKALDSRLVGLMKGLIEHLHHLVLEQIEVTSKLSSFSDSLQEHLNWTASSEPTEAIPGVVLRTFIARGQDILRDIVVVLDRHLLLLEAAPSRSDDHFERSEAILSVIHGPTEELFLGDPRWTELRDSIKIFREIALAKLDVFAVKPDNGPLYIVGNVELKAVQDVLSFFLTASGHLAHISELVLPASRGSVRGIKERMDAFIDEWSSLSPVAVSECSKIPVKVECILVECLKGLQNVWTQSNTLADKHVEGSKGHLAVLNLNDGVVRDAFRAFNTDKVFRSVQSLVRQVNQATWTPTTTQCLLLSRSFLETYVVLLYNLEVSGVRLLESSNLLLRVLLSVFSDILENGFGKVDDIEEETDKEKASEMFEESEQAGLGDGDGAKDVSEQIESEDQLEDTKTPGKEEEEKSKAEKIADEEHGVEMTDDFEGAMEDLAMEEQGSDEEEAEVPELDDQMGNLDGDQDNHVENLDKQFWEGEDEDEADPKEDEADQEPKSAEGQGVDQNERIDLAAQDNSLEDSSKDAEQQPMEENEALPEAAEPGEEAEEASGEGPDMDIPEKMEIDGEELIDEDQVPTEDASPDDKLNEETDLPDSVEDGMEKETEAGQQEEDSEIPEIAEDDALKASSTVPPTDKNESDMGTDGVGMPADLDNDRNDDLDNENEDDALNSDTNGRNTSATGRKSNDESGRDVDSRLPQTDPARKRQPAMEKRNLEPAAEKKTAGNRNESFRKRLKISQSQNQRVLEKQKKNAEKSDVQADMYEHVPAESDQFDDQVVDAASKEESKEQNADRLQQDDDMQLDQEDDDIVFEELHSEEDSMSGDTDTPENPPLLTKSKKDQSAQKKDSTKTSQQTAVVDVPEGEVIPTWGALPENTTFFGSQMALLGSFVPEIIDVDALRKELVQVMSTWSGRHFDSVEHEHFAMDLWRKYEAITQALSHELCEQLRLVLEPTKKSKLKGDYRTGKRLNMRKVVAYVASDFRKDKIWLRRTLPSQRQYQVLIAVDDSSSMADNQTKELAFESLAVLSNALTVLEVGELSICSFGQGVELLHPFQVPFSSSDGARVLTKFSFAQNKTNIAEMIALVAGVFDESRSRLLNVTNVSQLLLIVSDGRGIFREGVEVVKQSVRRLVNMGVFTVFVILDNPSESHKQGSVLDIRVPFFGGQGQALELRNYMQDFPFPFYLVLRNVKELPSTLCDALRQWFEMISSRD